MLFIIHNLLQPGPCLSNKRYARASRATRIEDYGSPKGRVIGIHLCRKSSNGDSNLIGIGNVTPVERNLQAGTLESTVTVVVDEFGGWRYGVPIERRWVWGWVG